MSAKDAATYAAEATVTPKGGDWFAPDGSLSAGWMVESDELRMSVDMEAADEAAARTKFATYVEDMLAQ